MGGIKLDFMGFLDYYVVVFVYLDIGFKIFCIFSCENFVRYSRKVFKKNHIRM